MPQTVDHTLIDSKVKFHSSTIKLCQTPTEKDKLSTRYCLNKPKIMREFRNSKLFQQTSNSPSLKPYTSRYTFNQKTNSFEKQNIEFIQSQFTVDFTMIENLNKSHSIEMPKLILLKRKSQNPLRQKTQKSSEITNLKPQTSNNHQKKKKKQTNNNKTCQKKFGRKHLILGRISEKRIDACNRSFFEAFPDKDEKKTIKEYINTNPAYFASQRPEKVLQKSNIVKALERSTLSRRTDRIETENVHSSFSNYKVKKLSNLIENRDSKEEEQIKSRKLDLFRLLEQEIDRLYDIVNQVKSLGYSEEKVHEWVWSYCQNYKKILKTILFKSQGYRSALGQHKLIYRMEEIEVSKMNVKRFKRTINNQEIFLQPSDISEVISYLEEILISKQYFQLKRLQTQIQDTSYAIRNNYLDMQDEKAEDILKLIGNFQDKKRLKPIQYYETLNFYEDAKRLETHFGKIKGLSTFNKRKCQNLTEIQIDIMRKKK